MNGELTSLAHKKPSKLTNLSHKESPLCPCSFIPFAIIIFSSWVGLEVFIFCQFGMPCIWRALLKVI